MTTSPLLEKKALGMNGTQSDSDVRRSGLDGKANGHAALDLAETVSVSRNIVSGIQSEILS
jgi:hypothetical protein